MLAYIINRCGKMLQNILEKGTNNQQSNRLKYHHLQTQNTNLLLTVKDLQTQIQSLRAVNQELLHKSPKSIQILIEELSRQNQNLQNSLFRLVKNNQELSCDILMKNQLICQAQRQFRDVISSFEEKIYEMRVSIQNKEIAVTFIEQKGLEDKEEPYGPTTRVNLMYFNQMSELKLMLDRISIENSQLRFLNCIKDEEIEKSKLLLEKYQKILEKRQELKGYKQSLDQQSNNSKTTKKQQAKNKLQQELTRYDMKYKHLSTTKTIHTPNQINSLKLMLTHLNKQNRNIRAQKDKLQAQIAIKNQQNSQLQQTYKKIHAQLLANKIEIQFYRENFKELCKIPTQRKIKFYGDYYQEILPSLQKKLHEKQNLISYWKQWKYKNEQLLTKCIMPKLKPLRRTLKRSNSSCAQYSYIKQSRKICYDRNKQQTIFNFINETHNVNSMINHTIEVQNKPSTKAQQIFNDDISIIIKPKVKQPESWKKRKPQMI